MRFLLFSNEILSVANFLFSCSKKENLKCVHVFVRRSSNKENIEGYKEMSFVGDENMLHNKYIYNIITGKFP